MKGMKKFTLIELLIVVGIIGILLTILLPSLTRARSEARKVVCMSNQSQMAKRIFFYSKENNGKMPGAKISIGHHTRSFFKKGTNWGTRQNFANLWDSIDEIREDSASGQMSYCPSQKNKGFKWESYSSSGTFPQSANPFGWSHRVRAGYNFNPGRVSNSWSAKYPRIEKFEEDTILITDLFTQANSLQSVGDVMSHADVKSFIFAKGDGGVKIKKASNFISTIRGGDWQTQAALNTVCDMLNE